MMKKSIPFPRTKFLNQKSPDMYQDIVDKSLALRKKNEETPMHKSPREKKAEAETDH